MQTKSQMKANFCSYSWFISNEECEGEELETVNVQMEGFIGQTPPPPPHTQAHLKFEYSHWPIFPLHRLLFLFLPTWILDWMKSAVQKLQWSPAIRTMSHQASSVHPRHASGRHWIPHQSVMIVKIQSGSLYHLPSHPLTHEYKHVWIHDFTLCLSVTQTELLSLNGKCQTLNYKYLRSLTYSKSGARSLSDVTLQYFLITDLCVSDSKLSDCVSALQSLELLITRNHQAAQVSVSVYIKRLWKVALGRGHRTNKSALWEHDGCHPSIVCKRKKKTQG